MTNSKYYDGTKILSMLDINGKKPEIYMITSNRTAGKTTYFHRLLLNRYFNKGEKFCLLYRFSYMLDDVAGKFFKDIGKLFFKEYTCISEKRSKGVYHEIYIVKKEEADNKDAWESVGYAIAINNGNAIKNFSHYFSDVSTIYFDEFQAEFGGYAQNEVQKFQSIHTSIARGNGEQVRYVPVIMSANTVSVINPYFYELGISTRIDKNTKFLKGDGFVLECNYNEEADKAQESSAFNRAFNNGYNDYQNKGSYMLDNTNFIEKMHGKSRYICTLLYNGKEYSVRDYGTILYVSKNVDSGYPLRLAIGVNSHEVNAIMVSRSIAYIIQFEDAFKKGAMRFQSLEEKEAMINMLNMKYK